MTTNKSKVETLAKKKSRSEPVQLSMPKDKFEEAIELLNDEGECDAFFEGRCSVPVQNICTINRSTPNCKTSFKLLEEARLCTLQRDWNNLARILTIAKPYRKDHILFFQVFVRYAVICLSHNRDKDLLDMFIQSVAGCSGEKEKQQFIRSLTNN